MTHLRIWKFRPPEGREQEFALAYAGDGVWAALFSKANGYLGSTLLRPVERGGCWLTIDRWVSIGDFDAFDHDFGNEYRSLDAELEGVAGEEEFVGAFQGD